MSRDFKRSFTVGITGFAVSGPLSFSIGHLVRKLYPGCGRLTVIKRTVMSTCLSPIVIACGIVPSVYLLTHNKESVHVGCSTSASWNRKSLSTAFPWTGQCQCCFLSPSPTSTLVSSFVVSKTLLVVQRTVRNCLWLLLIAICNSFASNKSEGHMDMDFIVDSMF